MLSKSRQDGQYVFKQVSAEMVVQTLPTKPILESVVYWAEHSAGCKAASFIHSFPLYKPVAHARLRQRRGPAAAWRRSATPPENGDGFSSFLFPFPSKSNFSLWQIREMLSMIITSCPQADRGKTGKNDGTGRSCTPSWWPVGPATVNPGTDKLQAVFAGS